MTFAERSESAMTELADKIASALVEGYEEMTAFSKYQVKDSILPVLATCIDVIDAEPHRAKRGDEIEAWIKRTRDEYSLLWTQNRQADEWTALDNLLDDYRLHADEGTPLSSDAD